MTAAWALALVAAQAGPGTSGEQVFRKTCAVVYCHGAQQEGEARAPALESRGFERSHVLRVTRDGIPRTSMPGFGKVLRAEEIEAVVDYVMRMSGPPRPQPAAAAVKAAAPAPDVKLGKELFFDPARVGACGSCHQLEGWGPAVGPDLKASAPADVAALRNVARRRVKTAQPSGEEPFPAMVAEQGKDLVRLYDVSAPLPVLRFFRPQEVKVTDGSAWSHAPATRTYSEEELGAIVAYLRSLGR